MSLIAILILSLSRRLFDVMLTERQLVRRGMTETQDEVVISRQLICILDHEHRGRSGCVESARTESVAENIQPILGRRGSRRTIENDIALRKLRHRA